MREADGLALSSRNARLGEKERALAPALHRALGSLVDVYNSGERRSAALIDHARGVIDAAGGFEIDYLEIVDGEALTPAATANDGCVVAVAAFLGGVRLIDNVSLARPRDAEAANGADIRMRSEDVHYA